MPLCDLGSSSGKLRRAANRLREQWAETKEHWQDGQAEEFESTFLQPLMPQLTLTIATIQKMAETLTDAEKECSDGDRGEGF